jgi:hypothetical protein
MAGDDRVSGGFGNTWITGGPGNDFLRTFNPAASLFGNEGNDILQAWGNGHYETLSGGDGNDCIHDDNASASSIDCGAGVDRVVGSPIGAVGCETQVISGC